MSYAPEFSRQVRRVLLDLDIEVAEFVLDEIERLLEHPAEESFSMGLATSQAFLTKESPVAPHASFLIKLQYDADEQTLHLETLVEVKEQPCWKHYSYRSTA